MNVFHIIILLVLLLSLMAPTRTDNSYKCGGCTKEFLEKEPFSKHIVRCNKFKELLVSGRKAAVERQQERQAAAAAAAAATVLVAADVAANEVHAEMNFEVRYKFISLRCYN